MKSGEEKEILMFYSTWENPYVILKKFIFGYGEL